MASFISTFITVGICLAIYAYIKKKYTAQIAELQNQIANLSLDVLHHKAEVKKLDDKAFLAEKEASSYKSRMETMIEINKELNAKYQGAPAVPKTAVVSTENTELKKRGRKPGSKKPFYKKKSGGNPS
jgi:cell division protein FtsB